MRWGVRRGYVTERYAIFPTRLNDGSWIWFERYTTYRNWLNMPVREVVKDDIR